jgi:hypothetical protein
MRPYRSVLPAFQAAGSPLWPLIGITGRAAVVSAGGWIVAHLTGAGLDGLAAIAAAGLAVYGASFIPCRLLAHATAADSGG